MCRVPVTGDLTLRAFGIPEEDEDEDEECAGESDRDRVIGTERKSWRRGKGGDEVKGSV